MNDATRVTTVMFDVDGTLIDSNGAHADAYLEALRLHGLKGDPVQIRRLIGMGGDKVIPEIAGVSEKSSLGISIAREKKSIFTRLLPALRPTRGARELLLFSGTLGSRDNGSTVWWVLGGRCAASCCRHLR